MCVCVCVGGLVWMLVCVCVYINAFNHRNGNVYQYNIIYKNCFISAVFEHKSARFAN